MREGSSEVREILDTIDVESFFDMEGIDYRRTHGSSGTQLNVRECPACGNSNWKVYINADTGFGNCFAGDCETRFNKWTFMFHYIDAARSRDVAEYARGLAREMGWRAKKKTSAATEEAKGSPKLPKSFEIPIKGRNLKYLEERGIDTDTARFFHLRFAKKGYFYYEVDGKKRWQTYVDRVLIPVFDLEGVLVSFQGRDITGKQEPKYLFPPGYASTGRFLYNGHNAHGLKRVVIGEGAFDVMAIKLALDEDMDLRDVGHVGTFGKHLSHGDSEGSDQLGQLLQLKQGGLVEVTFMWDGEPRALCDAADAALLLNKHGFKTRIAVLPDGKDPNEVPRSVVRQAYWQAIPGTKLNLMRLKMAQQGK